MQTSYFPKEFSELDKRLESLALKYTERPERGRRALKLASRMIKIENNYLRYLTKNYADKKDSTTLGLIQSLLHQRGDKITHFKGKYAGAFITATKPKKYSFIGEFAGAGCLFEEDGVCGKSSFQGNFSGAGSTFRGDFSCFMNSFRGYFSGANCLFEGRYACAGSNFEGDFSGFMSSFKGKGAGAGCSFKGYASGEYTAFVGEGAGDKVKFEGEQSGVGSSLRTQTLEKSIEEILLEIL